MKIEQSSKNNLLEYRYMELKGTRITTGTKTANYIQDDKKVKTI